MRGTALAGGWTCWKQNASGNGEEVAPAVKESRQYLMYPPLRWQVFLFNFYIHLAPRPLAAVHTCMWIIVQS